MEKAVEGSPCSASSQAQCAPGCATMRSLQPCIFMRRVFNRRDQGDEACGLRGPCAKTSQQAHSLCHLYYIKVTAPA